MDRDRLVLGLAAVFAGLTTLLVVTAFASQPFLILVAIPFGVTTYFLWFHASGRLAERTRRRRVQAERAAANGGTRRADLGGERGADPRRRARSNREAARQRARGRRARGAEPGAGAGRRTGPRGARASGARGRTGAPPRGPERLTREEALDTLGLGADADEDDIKRAYRERVKETHPDAPTGDEEAFKRVSAAYDRLTEE